MNEAMQLIPNPGSLPVAPLWLLLFLNLTYYFHLLSAGIMFGLSVESIFAYFKGRNNPQWKNIAVTMSKIIPFAIAFTVNLGVAPLLFLQVLYGNFFYSAAIVLGIPWLLLFIILILGYYGSYWLVFKKDHSPRLRPFIPIAISLIFAWVAFVLVNVNTLMLVPRNWAMYFNSMKGLNLNLAEPTLWPRYLFFIFLFLAIGGSFTALYYHIKNKNPEAKLGSHFASKISAAFVIISVLALTHFVLVLPETIKNSLLKNPVWLGLIIATMIALLASSILSYRQKSFYSAALIAFAVIMFVLIRNQIRILYLKPFADKMPGLAANSQYGVMILFFIILILGLTVTMWMLIKTAKQYQSSTNP